MKEIRVTAHFANHDEVLKAKSRLNKKCPNYYDEIRMANKKISFTTHWNKIPNSTIGNIRSLLEGSSYNVLHHLNDCKGLIYSVVVNQ